MANEFCSLGGIPFRTGPEQIRWDFEMKVKAQKTLGGKVIQVLGTTLGDLVITGRFGAAGRGETSNVKQIYAMRDQIVEWTRKAESEKTPEPIRFVYTPRNISLQVYVKELTPSVVSNADIAGEWTITMHIFEAGSQALRDAVVDNYIQKLAEGVGWKQTLYNGPDEAGLAEVLGGMTVGDYLAAQAQKAFDSGLPGGQIS